MAAVLLGVFFLVSFVATSFAIFADKPVMLAVAFLVAAYALKNDVERGLQRLRARSDR